MSSEAIEIDRDRLDAAFARELVVEQFPQWAGLPLRPVEPAGWDHVTFRLGDTMTVRLPSAPGYVPQVAKEQAWLPRLAPQLPLPIPTVVGLGLPTDRFPRPWSIYGWIAGDPAPTARIDDRVGFATDLAGFLVALRKADVTGAPGPGPHSAFRGGPLEHYDAETRDILPRLADSRERDLAAEIWRDALAVPFSGAPVWHHGDVALPNLLVREGRLSGVIDFGCAAVGDPSCDTAIAWTFFDGASRAAFVDALGVDEATWARGRGWAAWKALLMLDAPDPAKVALARRTFDALFAERAV